MLQLPCMHVSRGRVGSELICYLLEIRDMGH